MRIDDVEPGLLVHFNSDAPDRAIRVTRIETCPEPGRKVRYVRAADAIPGMPGPVPDERPDRYRAVDLVPWGEHVAHLRIVEGRRALVANYVAALAALGLRPALIDVDYDEPDDTAPTVELHLSLRQVAGMGALLDACGHPGARHVIAEAMAHAAGGPG